MQLKFLNFSKLKDRGGQKAQIWAKVTTRLKFLDFAKFHVLKDWGGQKSEIWGKYPT